MLKYKPCSKDLVSGKVIPTKAADADVVLLLLLLLLLLIIHVSIEKEEVKKLI